MAQARAHWRHYTASGHSRFRWLAAAKARYNALLCGLLWARPALRWRLWWY